MAKLQQITVDIYISSDEYLKYYQGYGQFVSCRARDGRRVQFPSALLQRFITREGIQGAFRILFDQQGKFSSIERLK